MNEGERAKRFADAAFAATGRGPLSDAVIEAEMNQPYRVYLKDGVQVREKIPLSDFYAAPGEIDEVVEAAEARMALAELLSRHPEWDLNPPCPVCGSHEHFEC